MKDNFVVGLRGYSPGVGGVGWMYGLKPVPFKLKAALCSVLRRPILCETRKKFAVVLNVWWSAVLLPILLNGADAMRANGHDFLDLANAASR